MQIKERIAVLKPKCEDVFYTLSKHMDRELAEKCVNDIMISKLNTEIILHEQFISTCTNHIERESLKIPQTTLDNGFEVGIKKGLILANEARLKSHQEAIKTAKFDIELLTMNLI